MESEQRAITARRHFLALALRTGAAAVLGGVARPALAQDTLLPASAAPTAPELLGGPWLNTPEEKPVTFASRKGKVTVVHYWCFG